MANLRIELTVPEESLVLDVTAFMAAIKFLAKSFWPGVKVKASLPCTRHHAPDPIKRDSLLAN
jgi:hypothetical protein